MANNCQFCGEYSGKYPLCRNCNNAKNIGEISKCEECGEWYITEDKCKCQKGSGLLSFIKEKILNRFEDNDEEYYDDAFENDDEDMDESICIICDEPSNGYLFCRNCYHKYKKKTILLSIANCKKIKLLKESYTDQYTYVCDDGHIVKSKSEQYIDNYFFNHNIRHIYEQEIRIDEKTVIHPDFYLPDLKVYIEHWGYGTENTQYTKQKKFKLDFYKKNNITLICTYEKSDGRNMGSALEMKLRNFQHGKINFEE